MKNCVILLFFLGCSHIVTAQKEFSSHRGSSLHAPENTVSAVSRAWQEGADAVEIDVHLSKDGRLMVIHDSNTKRTAGKEYVVKHTVSDTLRLLDVGIFKGAQYKNEKIPFLEEIIAIIPPGKKLYVEMKCGVDGLPILKTVVNSSSKRKQVDIICFDYEVVVGAKKVLPKNQVHLLVGQQEGLKDLIKKASLDGIDAIDLKHSLITQEIVDYIHSLSMEIYAWTVDDPLIAKKILALNIDGIETNCVPCLKAAMEKLGEIPNNKLRRQTCPRRTGGLDQSQFGLFVSMNDFQTVFVEDDRNSDFVAYGSKMFFFYGLFSGRCKNPMARVIELPDGDVDFAPGVCMEEKSSRI
jgi:glycerophosphoryl diester phosphodiesterase